MLAAVHEKGWFGERKEEWDGGESFRSVKSQ